MSENNHAAIEAFLQQQSITRLWEDVHSHTITHYNKAGVLPFVREGGFSYFFMKPVSTSPDLGEPPFQICKGTRQYQMPDGTWQDIRDGIGQHADMKETLAATALREGIEELGLKLDNIHQLMDMGAFNFSSATTGKTKYMWLFAAEIRQPDNFLSAAETTPSTQERKWLNCADFGVVGRKDHLYILKAIEASLQAHFKE